MCAGCWCFLRLFISSSNSFTTLPSHIFAVVRSSPCCCLLHMITCSFVSIFVIIFLHFFRSFFLLLSFFFGYLRFVHFKVIILRWALLLLPSFNFFLFFPFFRLLNAQCSFLVVWCALCVVRCIHSVKFHFIALCSDNSPHGSWLMVADANEASKNFKKN